MSQHTMPEVLTAKPNSSVSSRRAVAGDANEKNNALTELVMRYESHPKPLFARLPFSYQVIPSPLRAGILRLAQSVPHDEGGSSLGWPFETAIDVHADASLDAAEEPMWPHGARASLVITHDVDSAPELELIAAIRSIEREHGFPSAFGFVPRRSPPSDAIVERLVQEGCELYLHDIGHDGRLPYHPLETIRRELDGALAPGTWAGEHARGFRSGQLLWSSALRQAVGERFRFDLSIPDTERGGPYGGIAGCGTVRPFWIGELLEIPLTMPQDFYLLNVERFSPTELADMWTRKMDWIAQLSGCAVVNAHPIWINPTRPDIWGAYCSFLDLVAGRNDLWIATPSDIADWLGAPP
jgi:hypothetical protein